METLILLLLVVPCVFALLFTLGSSQKYYKILSTVLCITATTLSIILAWQGPQKIQVSGSLFQLIEGIILILELFIIVFMYWVSIKNKKWHVLILTIIQTALSIYTIFFMPKAEEAFFNVDKLSLVMALIVNIIGTLIVVFSNGYLTEYEHHRHIKSRQKLYYFMVSVFLSAMNGLILSDSLSWVYFFWEVTTISSFVLISYNNDDEAKTSGFRALFLNLIGGIAFSIGIILFKHMMEIDSLSQIIAKGKLESYFIIPVILLCIAGFAKSAQMPFQSWLLGAMVAPTPVSALLHSSTMVKAGVYLIVKLAPAYAGTRLGTAIAIYGGFTFLICSLIAVTQRNAKRVLAYSTIANLGLIISSAGIGSSIAVSAAIMLIIFHAISKALLFLCTGQTEHTIGSRDIEDMTGLISKAPLLTILLALGMLSMLLPPFGVLVTKWISIEASASNPIVVVFLVLGSALTTVYYVKWLGTILTYSSKGEHSRSKMGMSITIPLIALSSMIILTSIFITQVFNYFVSPEISFLLKGGNELAVNNGTITSNIGSFNEGIVFLAVAATVIIYLFVKKLIMAPKIKKVYMCGENNSEMGNSYFRNSDGSLDKFVVSNVYLDNYLNEKKITFFGYIISIAIIVTTFIGGLL